MLFPTFAYGYGHFHGGPRDWKIEDGNTKRGTAGIVILLCRERASATERRRNALPENRTRAVHASHTALAETLRAAPKPSAAL